MKIVVGFLQSDKISGILSYRRKFPKELVALIPSASPTGRGRVEFKTSLKTRDINSPGAMERFANAQREYNRIVAAARRAKAFNEKHAVLAP